MVSGRYEARVCVRMCWLFRHLAQKSDASDEPSSGETGRGTERAKRASVWEAVAGGSVISPFCKRLSAFARKAERGKTVKKIVGVTYLVKMIDSLTVPTFPLPCAGGMTLGRPAAAVEASKTTPKQGHRRNKAIVDIGNRERTVEKFSGLRKMKDPAWRSTFRPSNLSFIIYV